MTAAERARKRLTGAVEHIAQAIDPAEVEFPDTDTDLAEWVRKGWDE